MSWEFINTCLNISFNQPRSISPVRLTLAVSKFSNINLELPSYQFNLPVIIEKMRSDHSSGRFTLGRREMVFILVQYQEASQLYPETLNYVQLYLNSKTNYHETFLNLLISAIMPLEVRQVIIGLKKKENHYKTVQDFYIEMCEANNLTVSIVQNLLNTKISLLLIVDRLEKGFNGLALKAIIKAILYILPLDNLFSDGTESLIIFCQHLAETYNETNTGNVVLDKFRTTELSLAHKKILQTWIQETVDLNAYDRSKTVRFSRKFLGAEISVANIAFLSKFLDWTVVQKTILKDSERQNFWYQHWDKVESYEFHRKGRSNESVAMRFGEVWIIEKSDRGAMYCYSPNRYELKKSESDKSFIDNDDASRVRVPHTQGWQGKITYILNRIYSGQNIDAIRPILDLSYRRL